MSPQLLAVLVMYRRIVKRINWVWENRTEGLLNLLIKKGRPSKKKARYDTFDRNVISMTVEALNVQQKIVPKIKNIFSVIYKIHGEMERTKGAGSSGNICVLYLGGAWFVSWLGY